MNSDLQKSLVKKIALIIFWMVFYMSAADAEQPENPADQPKLVLNEERIRFFDTDVAKKVPACRFVYNKAPINTVTGNGIYQCIEGLSSWHDGIYNKYYNPYNSVDNDDNYVKLGISEQQFSNILLLDDYLGQRLLPYAVGIAQEDQAILLRKIAYSSYSSNKLFIQAMIDQGASTKAVLLQQVNIWGTSPCDQYRPFLTKNIELYQQKETLYEPIPNIFYGSAGLSGAKLLYRWNDLFYLTDSSERLDICNEAIELLVKAQPELLNKRHWFDGATPLHWYLRNRYCLPLKTPDLALVRVLTNTTNINMQASDVGTPFDGNTPLHELLSNRCGNPPMITDKSIVEWLISQGANIHLKNKEGITAKDLILKRPDLAKL